MMEHLNKNSETYKNRNVEYEQLQNQCQEIYQPPYVIKPKQTVFDLQSKIDRDVRMAMPTEKLAKRKKVPEMGSGRKEKNNPGSAANAQALEMAKKQTTYTSQKTSKETAKKNMQKQKLDQIYKEEIEVKIERENVQNVDFNELFTDNLPQKAIELRDYVLNKMKDQEDNGEEKTEQALINARKYLEQVRNFATHTQPFYLMVSDIITPPKGVQMVKP